MPRYRVPSPSNAPAVAVLSWLLPPFGGPALHDGVVDEDPAALPAGPS